jgi:hypothetical protein
MVSSMSIWICGASGSAPGGGLGGSLMRDV